MKSADISIPADEESPNSLLRSRFLRADALPLRWSSCKVDLSEENAGSWMPGCLDTSWTSGNCVDGDYEKVCVVSRLTVKSSFRMDSRVGTLRPSCSSQQVEKEEEEEETV